jgi:hypothetical protein
VIVDEQNFVDNAARNFLACLAERMLGIIGGQDYNNSFFV